MNLQGLLNEKQQEAVCHTEGPLLILAGAGSGKTRVLTHRIGYLIEEKGVNPWNILAITFTNKAAGEMRERVDQLVGAGADSIWVSTFHSMCVRILRRHIDLLGYDTNFTIYDTDDQKTMMKEICKMLQINTKIYREKSLLSAISNAKNEMLSSAEMRRQADGEYGILKVAEVYDEYEKQMQSNNALDFDDLLLKTVELFKAHSEVLEYYQERFKYIMVDEYQDTNTVQFELVRLLASKYKNLCVVGDDDQSIYRFRGANIRNILNFEKHFPDTKVVKLEQNYRSTEHILNVANAVIRHNAGRKEKTLWTDNGEGEKIKVRHFDSAYDEAEYVVSDIASKVREGTCSYSDNAILYRTNAQSRLFEERFITANIPYKIVGGLQFYARKEIKDLLAYLKTIDNGQDDLAVRRIVNVPKRGIGLTTINKVQDYALAHELDFYQALVSASSIPGIGKGAQKVESFVALIEAFKQDMKDMSLSDLLQKIIEDTGYMESLDGEDEQQIQARTENIDELCNKIASYEEVCDERDEPATLSGFLEDVALVADIDSLDESSEYVVLMTLHSAKGLEFPRVYLVGMEDRLFPSYRTITSDDTEELEEERRLCYVGITRAQDDLTFTWASRRMIHGETQYCKISRFLKEIPVNLLTDGEIFEKIDTAAGRKQEPVFAQNRDRFKRKAFGEVRSVRQFGDAAKKEPEYKVGDTVYSSRYGEGIVLEIAEGGRDYEVTVEFANGNIRKIFAAFGQLVKL